MRNIKFRAWLKEPKIMTEVKGFTEFENKIPYGRGKFVTEKLVKVVQNENINALWWCYGRDDGEETECEIMQYTGLKDCKGKEIYEGDILQSIEGGVIIEVRFNAFHAMFEKVILKSIEEYWIGSTSMFSKYICDNYYVIGNIYENRDLYKIFVA